MVIVKTAWPSCTSWSCRFNLKIMKYSFILFLLISFLCFVACGDFGETEESDEDYYSRNPHCTIFFYNQSDMTVYVRVDCRFHDGNETKWIMEGWAKEIKNNSMDSLCVLAMEANNLQPSWLDLLNNNHRDSVVVSVFDTFKNAVRYEKKYGRSNAIKQYLFVTKDLGGGNTKEIVFVNDENDNKK